MDLRQAKGRRLGSVTFPVERGKLRELAHALHDEDPVWHDPEATRAAGFDGVPAPPTAPATRDGERASGASSTTRKRCGCGESAGDPNRLTSPWNVMGW